MTIAPGADCIQGLRWSYMQIERVSLSSGPSNGKVVIVGPGFRYFADPGFRGSDSFTVSVSGKNRKASGNSILQFRSALVCPTSRYPPRRTEEKSPLGRMMEMP
ncbi:MAG: hypothetical protein JWP08_3323 [Bryobacterales bacterium]|nr:hypothetical protein [Bryobacterales bacterium]